MNFCPNEKCFNYVPCIVHDPLPPCYDESQYHNLELKELNNPPFYDDIKQPVTRQMEKPRYYPIPIEKPTITKEACCSYKLKYCCGDKPKYSLRKKYSRKKGTRKKNGSQDAR